MTILDWRISEMNNAWNEYFRLNDLLNTCFRLTDLWRSWFLKISDWRISEMSALDWLISRGLDSWQFLIDRSLKYPPQVDWSMKVLILDNLKLMGLWNVRFKLTDLWRMNSWNENFRLTDLLNVFLKLKGLWRMNSWNDNFRLTNLWNFYHLFQINRSLKRLLLERSALDWRISEVSWNGYLRLMDLWDVC